MLRRPMPLVRIPEPFDHPDWLFELKHDGFRALAYVEGHRCCLVSRRGHPFAQRDLLCEEPAHSVKATRAVLDGELVCLGDDGRSRFHRLLFRRDWPFFYAFDLLEVDGEDLRDQPLTARKRRLRQSLPREDSRLLYVDHLERCGSALFHAACARDLEGIVAKWRRGRYERDGLSTSGLKIKNPAYSQMVGRRELFEPRTSRATVTRLGRRGPILRLHVA
jgi:bifunctional non-homologous end joining protein LigD